MALLENKYMYCILNAVVMLALSEILLKHDVCQEEIFVLIVAELVRKQSMIINATY